MRKIIITLFQTIVVLFGLFVFCLMVYLPTQEGRAKELNLFQIYADPFILYGYALSILFFLALYKIVQLLGNIKSGNIISTNTIQFLKTIKYCAVLLAMGIIAAGVFIMFTHQQDDDPAGFFALCSITTFLSFVVAFVAYRAEISLRKKLAANQLQPSK